MASCVPRHPAPRTWAPDAACLKDARSCFWCWYLNRVPVRANLECEPEGAGRASSAWFTHIARGQALGHRFPVHSSLFQGEGASE